MDFCFHQEEIMVFEISMNMLDSWGRKESDTTERWLIWSDLSIKFLLFLVSVICSCLWLMLCSLWGTFCKAIFDLVSCNWCFVTINTLIPAVCASFPSGLSAEVSQPTSETSVSAQSCPTLCDPMGCRPPGSSVHGILQARKLEWVAIPSSVVTLCSADHLCNPTRHSLIVISWVLQ